MNTLSPVNKIFWPSTTVARKHVKLGLPRRVVNLELVLFPLEAVAVLEPAGDGDRLFESAGCAAPGGRVFQHLSHFLQRPDLGAFMPDQIGDTYGVVVVYVAVHNDVDLLRRRRTRAARRGGARRNASYRCLHGPIQFPCARSRNAHSRGRTPCRTRQHHVEVRARLRTAPQEVSRKLNETRVGKKVEAVIANRPEDPHRSTQAREIHQALFKAKAVSDRIGDGLPMGRQRKLRCALAQGLAGLQREQRACLIAVSVFHGVILVQHAPGPDQVAGERDFLSIDLADEHAASMRVALRREDLQLKSAPGERLVVEQRFVNRHVLAD